MTARYSQIHKQQFSEMNANNQEKLAMAVMFVPVTGICEVPPLLRGQPIVIRRSCVSWPDKQRARCPINVGFVSMFR